MSIAFSLNNGRLQICRKMHGRKYRWWY